MVPHPIPSLPLPLLPEPQQKQALCHSLLLMTTLSLALATTILSQAWQRDEFVFLLILAWEIVSQAAVDVNTTGTVDLEILEGEGLKSILFASSFSKDDRVLETTVGITLSSLS